ncbi:hypothetical protein [Sphaerisporangium siamense]|uniref:Uncharacterized protein n=1 Tax=Sphaerisporangium siamense TaxID=795645 RepID=A0A7W7D4C9_9ACTN|nr:hypothetical protein [Sphaerisporangium siamense]MBB4700095.1 hypothetical protein [Sphaerisporangium siamense]
MSIVMDIVTVDGGRLVSRATLADDGTVTYEGGESAASAVRRWRIQHPGKGEADAVRALAREGWSNGYLMVATNTTP